MNPIAIFGAGSVGREIAVLIQQINLQKKEWELIGFFDDHHSKGTKVHEFEVLGGLTELNNYPSDIYIVLAMGDCISKRRTVNHITNEKVKFATLIHPSVTISDFQYIKIGKGSIITAGNLLTCDIEIANHVLINLNCTIGHDVKIGDFSSLMPGCQISGYVQIEECVYIGTGASLIKEITVESNVTIGAGAVVIENIKQGLKVVGVPANIIYSN